MPSRRSIYLINPKFQLKLAFFISSLIFIIGLVYPWIIFKLFHEFAELSNNPEVIQRLAEKKSTLAITLGLMHMLYLGIVFVISIFQGHKVAGPIHKLNIALKQVIQGGPLEKVNFRKNDNFHDLAVNYSSFIEHILKDNHQKAELLDEINKSLNSHIKNLTDDQKGNILEVMKKIQQVENDLKHT